MMNVFTEYPFSLPNESIMRLNCSQMLFYVGLTEIIMPSHHAARLIFSLSKFSAFKSIFLEKVFALFCTFPKACEATRHRLTPASEDQMREMTPD